LAGSSGGEEGEEGQEGASRGVARRLVAPLGIVAAGVFLWWIFEGFLPPPAPEAATLRQAPPGVESILLLPVDGNGDPSESALVYARVAGELRALPGLRVVTGEATGPALDDGALAGIQGVTRVVRTTLEVDGGRALLTVRLYDPVGPRELWAGRFQEHSRDLARMAVTGARALARELAVPPG